MMVVCKTLPNHPNQILRQRQVFPRINYGSDYILIAVFQIPVFDSVLLGWMVEAHTVFVISVQEHISCVNISRFLKLTNVRYESHHAVIINQIFEALPLFLFFILY